MNAPTTPQHADQLQRSELQARVVQSLQAHLPTHALLWHNEDTTPFECDGLTAYRQRPLVVALPETMEQVQAVLKTCHGLGAVSYTHLDVYKRQSRTWPAWTTAAPWKT